MVVNNVTDYQLLLNSKVSKCFAPVCKVSVSLQLCNNSEDLLHIHENKAVLVYGASQQLYFCSPWRS